MKKEDREILDTICSLQEELESFKKDIIKDATETILNDLFDLRVEMVNRAIDLLDMRMDMAPCGLSMNAWMREFATITISLGRQSGSTHFLHRLDDVLPDGNICIIFPTYSMLHNFKKHKILSNSVGSDRTYGITPNEICGLRKEKFKYIALECGEHFTETQLDSIYNFAVDTGAKAIINVF
jgi:hypothetical protein